jgi:hypothetical protein
MDPKQAREKVADLLDSLANGDTVALGDFSDNGSDATEADVLAERLRELAEAERAEVSTPDPA